MDNKHPIAASKRLAFSVKEAADLLGVSTASIRRAIQRGQLQPCRKFRHILVTRQEIERFLGITNWAQP